MYLLETFSKPEVSLSRRLQLHASEILTLLCNEILIFDG